jgi:ELWxxDGT repeat protein
MKKNLLVIAALFAGFFATSTDAQVIQLDNNHSLSGFPIIPNKIILTSDIDSTFWTSDGTGPGTKIMTNRVKEENGGVLNNKIYFSGIEPLHGSELWITDGTDAGTSLVSDIVPGGGSSSPDNFVLFKNDLYFTAKTATAGRELYKISGANGTVTLFKDINAGAGSGFDSTNTSYFIANNLLYFTATNGINGMELWVTDGTAGNTFMLKDITPGAGDTNFGFGQFAQLGNEVIFGINVGANSSLDIWKTNGTTAGTLLVKSFNVPFSGFIGGFLSFKNKLYFAGTDLATGTELWSTDGTTTEMIADINPGTDGSYPLVLNSVIINNRFIFMASTKSNGSELWSSDGIKGGSTTMIKDINPGIENSSPVLLPVFNFDNIINGNSSSDFFYNRTQLFNGYIFLIANDGVHGQELWKTDGTAANTVMVKDLNPGAADGFSGGLYFYTKTGFYFGGDNGATGDEPFVTDGTAVGTSLVKDINPGTGGSNPGFLFLYNGSLYFTADNGDSPEGFTDLYKLNGSLTSLPVTLLDFSASPQSSAVQLKWTTSSESNSSYFGIERSTDGSNFTELNQVQAAGNSSVEKHYGYSDNSAFDAGSDVLYYRLKLTDADGKIKYSEILNVKLKAGITAIRSYPNPVRDHLSIVFNSTTGGKVLIRITDLSGKQLYIRNYNQGISSNLQNVDVSGYASGTYFIQMVTDKETKTIKFVK